MIPQQDLHTKLFKTLAQVKGSTKDIEKIHRILLTKAEIDDISLRLEILRLLKEGQTQRSIAKSLGVGIATVTRGSRQLQQLDGDLSDFLR